MWSEAKYKVSYRFAFDNYITGYWLVGPEHVAQCRRIALGSVDACEHCRQRKYPSLSRWTDWMTLLLVVIWTQVWWTVRWWYCRDSDTAELHSAHSNVEDMTKIGETGQVQELFAWRRGKDFKLAVGREHWWLGGWDQSYIVALSCVSRCSIKSTSQGLKLTCNTLGLFNYTRLVAIAHVSAMSPQVSFKVHPSSLEWQCTYIC